MENEYLQQVQQEAIAVQNELKRKAAPMPAAAQALAPARGRVAAGGPSAPEGGGFGAPAAHEGAASLGVRITGFWPFQTVVVPPNMYVVHTRRGHDKPVTVGLGRSFRYDPYADSFLIVPSAMQTIQISARSICKELQGILIQAYVQWIIADVQVAYSRLDFSDIDDPMRVVNVQLREQAEAAIKDKVATMSIHEVLSDKQPIIEELTRRLKTVAEGSGDDQGLGIRIVTVQIKEAVVSSTRLWENLQGPFRAEQRTKARLAEIAAEEQIGERERIEREARETADLEAQAKIDATRAGKEAEAFDREEKEARRRHLLEQEASRLRADEQGETRRREQAAAEEVRRQKLALEHQYRVEEREKAAEAEKKRLELEVQGYQQQIEELNARLEKDRAARRTHWELATLELEESDRLEAARLEALLARQGKELEARNAQTKAEIAFEGERRDIANRLSEEHVRLEAVRSIPAIAKALPTPERFESISVGGADGTNLAGLLAQVMGVLRSYGVVTPSGGGAPEARAPAITD